MSVRRKVNNETILAAAAHAVNGLRSQHGPGILKAFYKRKETSDNGGLKFVLPGEDKMSELEAKLAHGLIEAMVCYEHDARNFGMTDVNGLPVESKLVGVGTASAIADIGRQRIQDLCNKGYLPHITEPYHGRILIVRRAAVELKKTGNPNLREAGE